MADKHFKQIFIVENMPSALKSKVVIRKMRATDLAKLLKLGREEWPKDEWLTKEYLREAQRQKGLSFVALAGEELVGGVIHVSQDIVQNWLRILIVSPKYRGLGIGTELVNAVVERLRPGESLLVDAAADERKTLHFYKKLGFRNRGRIKSLYGHQAAFVYEKVIAG